MSNDLDAMLKEAPSLTFEPFGAQPQPEVPVVKQEAAKAPEGGSPCGSRGCADA